MLSMKEEDFLDRRLQTIVWRLGLAKSVHHARVLIKQKHIRVGKQIVDVPSFLVRVDSERHIDFALNSPFGGGRPGRNKRKSLAAKASLRSSIDISISGYALQHPVWSLPPRSEVMQDGIAHRCSRPQCPIFSACAARHEAFSFHSRRVVMTTSEPARLVAADRCC